tara:strand:+ start:792 stop:1109 length:318 start_codon:yes stop_codon:yes gene_type:complete
MTYKPLPLGLFIKESNIEGQGIFTNRNLTVGCDLGESHYDIDNIFIRTPLGGFINHSNTPNCARKKIQVGPSFVKWDVIVVENIAAGDELTLKYTMYNPKEENEK